MGDDVSTADVLRAQIASLVRQYYQEQFADRTFTPETDLVHYAGRVFDADELCNLVDASLDFFLTANRYADEFEADFADYLGVSTRAPGELRVVGEPRGADRPDLAEARRPAAQAGRRSRDRGGGVSHDGCADPAEQPGAGVRRRQPRRLHRDPGSAARGDRPTNARDHDGAHARRAVRPRRRDATSRSSTTSGWSRTTATRWARGIAAG